MPELPEVETVRRNLDLFLPGKSLKEIKILYPKTLKNSTEETLNQELSNQIFDSLERRAKYLILPFKKSSFVLVVHLRMTGCFLIRAKEQELSKHARIVLKFNNSDQSLIFDDLRTFGKFSLYQNKETAFRAEGLFSLAPEPKDLELVDFQEKLKKSQSQIKTLLLDQKKAVSGLGNIYTDEALFLSGIHPERISSSLKQAETVKLYHSIQKVISQSIEKGGTTINNYLKPDGEIGKYALDLNVYGQKNKDCKVCATKIVYTKVNQRGTHFCPSCQVK